MVLTVWSAEHHQSENKYIGVNLPAKHKTFEELKM